MFKRKYSVTILDENWNKLLVDSKLEFIPRRDEFIFLDSLGKYFKVLNVIHYLTNKQGIFVVVKEFQYEISLQEKKLLK